MKIVTFIFLGLTLILSSDRFPEAEITNNIIKAKLYLPDDDKGYYRGIRFDRAGNIYSLKVNGHEYFGQWFGEYDPEKHDAIMGPAEEFAPLGFTEAQVGETFVKIGVGILTKIDDRAYSFTKRYPVVNSGKRSIKEKSDQVEFIHEINNNDYSYIYSKIVRLVPGKAEMELVHSLKNTGKKTIDIQGYNHNFFMIDNQKVGPDYSIIFPRKIKGEGNGFGVLADIDDNKIIFLKELQQGESAYCGGIEGVDSNPLDYDIRIENKKSGAGVRITCDRPLLKQVFWACWTAPCPEPYIMINAEPGQEFTWTIKYEFYNL